MTNIYTHHLRSTVLKKAIGKTAGRLADIQAAQTRHIQACGFQRAFQFQAASRNVFGFGVVQHFQFSRFGNLIAVFSNALPGSGNFYLINLHPPLNTRTNQALGLRASGGKAMFNKKKISSHREI